MLLLFFIMFYKHLMCFDVFWLGFCNDLKCFEVFRGVCFEVFSLFLIGFVSI